MYRKILFIAIILILIAPCSIRGSGLLEEIEIFRGDIKIAVNNTSVEPEEQPFIYNDKVYVPLRFISNSLGKEVKWVPESRAVIIKEPDLKLPIEDCRPNIGEIFVYGKILKVDYNNYIIEIAQHFDDNSVEVNPTLTVNRNVIIVKQKENNKEENIHFYQLKKGDIGGFILDNAGKVRGIIVTR